MSETILVVIEQYIAEDNEFDSINCNYLGDLKISIKKGTNICSITCLHKEFNSHSAANELAKFLYVKDIFRVTQPHVNYINYKNNHILLSKVATFELYYSKESCVELNIWLEKIFNLPINKIIEICPLVKREQVKTVFNSLFKDITHNSQHLPQQRKQNDKLFLIVNRKG